MTETPALDKILRLAGGQVDDGLTSGPDLRDLLAMARADLREAVTTADPAIAAVLVFTALSAIDGAAEQLYVELSGPAPDNPFGLAVLSTAERKKPGAHTIAGSTDFPIPDRGHLQAAIARYKQGALAGHSKDEVAAHIRSRAKALGVEVDLSNTQCGPPVLLELARGKAAVLGMAQCSSEHHPPMHGTHEHAHTHSNDASHGTGWDGSHMMGMAAGSGVPISRPVGPPTNRGPANMHATPHGSMTGTHSHPHTHLGDNMHGGQADHAVGARMDAHQQHMAHLQHLHHEHVQHLAHMEHVENRGAAPAGGGMGASVVRSTGMLPGGGGGGRPW